jgi:L-ascorbate metabolism protein UlaG (beta-lactamase superfamily)
MTTPNRHGDASLTYVGGPTIAIDFCGLRFLTDPTFDAGGGEYATAVTTLTKIDGPAIALESLGQIDIVLLSHDHHFDNLDRAGRAMLGQASQVLTTPIGAERLGGGAVGMAPWESRSITAPDGHTVRVTSTPARHGPEGGDRGPVTGFVLQCDDALDRALYVSGDTVWYEGVAEVAARFHVTTAVLFMGAARVAAAGPAHITMTAEDGVHAARAFSDAVIVPVHFEGWRHFSESRPDIERVFAAEGLSDRLRWPEAGRAITLSS